MYSVFLQYLKQELKKKETYFVRIKIIYFNKNKNEKKH